MSNKLQLRVFICSLILFVVSMSSMLAYAQNKAVVIDEVQGQLGLEEEQQVVSDKIIVKNLNIQKPGEGEISGSFVIPLPQGIAAEQVSIENKYILQELWVSIKGCEGTFFGEQWITGDTSSILSGTYEIREDRVVLKLLLKDIYECKNLLENGRLVVGPVDPHLLYDYIVIVDPLNGDLQWSAGRLSISENDVALDVAKKLQAKCVDTQNEEQTKVKVYFTRLENVDRSLQLRQHFVETLGADLVICIGTGVQEEAFGGEYGVEAWYNTYFTPNVSSVKAADELVKAVVKQVVGKGNGVWEGVDENQLYYEAKAPTVLLHVGYLSNGNERELLAQDDYRTKIAEGIFAAIEGLFKGEETNEP